MNNTHVYVLNANTKATKIENTLPLLLIGFNVVINLEIIATSPNYIDNYSDEKVMAVNFLNDMTSYAP
ncbi:MAG: hypothetical protein Ta2E_00570 [Mycoplasmoidaceae bacterium]|nr:MAG: hypothetical protein Ta2E_00570 [Mycoplasmoidaceae bacterium]